MKNPKGGAPHASRSKRLAALSILTAVLAATPAQCGTNPSGNPLGGCPAGTSRVRDVTRPPGQQWVCAR